MPLLASTLRRTRRRTLLGLGLAAGAAAALAGCGSGDKVPPPLSRASMQSQLQTLLPTTPPALMPSTPASSASKGYVPKAVAELERKAGTVLPGDASQALTFFEARLNALRGTPVVVNLWGDWCVPCQKEIPVFQRVALAYRGRVAFLGVATFSSRAKTVKYLANKLWLPYPSVLDDHGQVVATTHVSNVPQTIFYSATGKRFVHIGPYTSVTDLETDIKRYTA